MQLSEKTVVRDAIGIFYGGEEKQDGNPNRGESAPFNLSPQFNRPAGYSDQFQPDPFFANGAAIGGITCWLSVNVFNDFRFPHCSSAKWQRTSSIRWSRSGTLRFSINCPGNMVAEVGYQGNHPSHQLLQPDSNTCPNFYTTNSSITCNALRPQPDVGSVSGTATFGFGNYDAMIASLQKRMSAGLTFQAAYTWSYTGEYWHDSFRLAEFRST